jgi:hypothetical protein
MMNANTALDLLLGGLAAALAETGFAAVKKKAGEENPEGAALFSGEAGTLRVKLEDDRAALHFCESQDALEGEYRQLSLSLLELETATERDCRYVADEFAEALREKFRKGRKGVPAAAKKGPPKSVSKTAIKNGDAYYDALSFGNSFTGIFPELRADYRANYERYGEFLPEEFFLGAGTATVMATIKRNDPAQMRRLFNLFNEVYENGVNDVQSLVAVTILGSLENDQTLLARCADYMSGDLAPVVIRVNRCLASDKDARRRLENPPPYRPKKAKKPGFLQQLMGGGGQPGMPGV